MEFDRLVKKKEISLNRKRLRDGDLDVLVKVLKKSKALKHLDLRGNKITLADGKFTSALARNHTLRELYLHDNNIGPEGAKNLAAALKINQTIKELFLSSNQLGDKGSKSIADALMSNSSLRVLGLGLKNIGDEGANSLAASFLANQSLSKVWLQNNKISDKGAKKMADSLQCNCTIEELDLEGNGNVSKKIVDGIEAIFKYPNRGSQNVPGSGLNQLMDFIASKDKEIASKDQQIATKDAVIEGKDNEIASLKATLSSPLNQLEKEKEIASKDQQIATKDAAIKAKDNEIASLKATLSSPPKHLENDKEIASKDQQIATKDAAIKEKDDEITSLKATLSSPLKLLEKYIASKDEEIASLKATVNKSQSINHTVDLTSEEAEPTSKRQRSGNTAKSYLPKLIQVKQEKHDVETALNSTRVEKEAAEANLEEARDDLGDANDLVEQQALATDIWQRRFDELASLVAGQVDGAALSAIRHRSLASGS